MWDEKKCVMKKSAWCPTRFFNPSRTGVDSVDVRVKKVRGRCPLRHKSVDNQKKNTFMRLFICQRDFDTHNSSNSVWLTPKLINPIWFIAMGQKQDRKYQNQEMSTFFFALSYVLASLQRSRLYVNKKKSTITRVNAFLKFILLSVILRDTTWAST